MARKFVPSVDGLEPKFLLRVGVQALPVSIFIPTPTVQPPSVAYPNSPSTPPFVPNSPLYTPDGSGGQPTAVEIARERYAASFAGPLTTGPALFTNEAGRIYIRGVGFSTQFRHGNIQMGIVLPNAPGQPIFGAAYVQDQNLVGSNQIGLDIQFDPNSLDAHGRPTLGAWSTDPNIYSGLDFVAKGSGSVLIRYAGRNAYVIFKGSLYSNGLTSPLGNSNLQP